MVITYDVDDCFLRHFFREFKAAGDAFDVHFERLQTWRRHFDAAECRVRPGLLLRHVGVL